MGRFTSTPYMVLFILLGAVGVSTAYAAITITLAADVKITGDTELDGKLIDTNNEAGTSGQVLSSTETGIDWIDAASGLESATGATGMTGMRGDPASQTIKLVWEGGAPQDTTDSKQGGFFRFGTGDQCTATCNLQQKAQGKVAQQPNEDGIITKLIYRMEKADHTRMSDGNGVDIVATVYVNGKVTIPTITCTLENTGKTFNNKDLECSVTASIPVLEDDLISIHSEFQAKTGAGVSGQRAVVEVEPTS